jgi:excisionase family DNA binding protein
MENEKKVLTPFEAAKELGCNPKSIYKELQAGNIPHVKIGDRYIIGRAAFEKWLEGRQSQGIKQSC